MRSKAWVEGPTSDVRYVWADENNADALARTGQTPIYVDANPAVSSSWGGRVNDGFHRGSHLRADRVANSDRVVLTAIAPIHADEELYLEYGADYWQGHYHTLPPPVQAEAAAHYDLTVVAGRCYTPAQRLAASSNGEIHRIGKRWYAGPAPTPSKRRTPRAPPAPPRLAPCAAPPPPPPAPTPPGHPVVPPPDLTSHEVLVDASHRETGTRVQAPPREVEAPATQSPGPGPPHPALDPTPGGSPSHARGEPAAPPPLPPLPTCREHSPTPATLSLPPDWTHLTSSIISDCLCLTWSDTATNRQALTNMLDAGQSDLGYLFAHATAADSPLTFRLWRTAPGPPTPWFSPGPLDGITMDYMMKARAASGLRAPKRHGTLQLTEAADYQALAQHCVQLGLLPSPPPPHLEDSRWDTVGSLTPSTLHQYRDEALPYTCFVETPDPTPGPPPTYHYCYSDSRLPHVRDFSWGDLQIIGTNPNYCRSTARGFGPLTVSAPTNEVERIRWGIHSLCQHTLEAFLRLSLGPPQPTWRRGRNKRGLSAFAQGHPNPPTSVQPGPPRPSPGMRARPPTAASRRAAHGAPPTGAIRRSTPRWSLLAVPTP